MAILWSDRYSVNIPQIDLQHKALVDIINKLEEVISKKDTYLESDVILNEVIDEAKNYTVLHFATEEMLMDLFEYPDYIEHKAGHDRFVELVLSSQADLKDVLQRRRDASDKDEISRLNLELQTKLTKVLTFLQQWLINHIMKSDREYTEFFLKIKKKAVSTGGWLAFLKR